jgi:catalase
MNVPKKGSFLGIKTRATLNFYKADREFGERIAKGLNVKLSQEIK